MCSIFYKNTATAQDSTESKTSFLKYEISYLNDNVYLGRKDSVKVPYASSSIGYYHKSGLYATATASFLPTESRIDAYIINMGYTFAINKLEGELGVEKNFYNAQSYNVNSEVKGSASGSLAFNGKIVKPMMSGSINFGISSDYAASFGLEHSFLIGDAVDISPSLIFNASTQNAYDSYYQRRRYAITKRGVIVPYTITANATDVNRFKIRDYEFSLPINYEVNKITFNFSPTLAVPINPNVIIYNIREGTGPGVTRTATEKVSPCFYWSLGISLKI
ncbi:MAG: hypothetical protein NVS9B7_23570 [Flavisolibacter sp.]